MKNFKLVKVMGFQFAEFTPYVKEDFELNVIKPEKTDKHLNSLELTLGVEKEKNIFLSAKVSLTLPSDEILHQRDIFDAIDRLTKPNFQEVLYKEYKRVVKLGRVKRVDTYLSKIEETVNPLLEKISGENLNVLIDSMILAYNKKISEYISDKNKAAMSQLQNLCAGGLKNWESGIEYVREKTPLYKEHEKRKAEIDEQIKKLKQERDGNDAVLLEYEYAVIREDLEEKIKEAGEFEKKIREEALQHIALGTAANRVGRNRFPF